MKPKGKISYLVGRVQRSLFSHFNNCLDMSLQKRTWFANWTLGQF
jgi:hypothetical protein